MEEECSDEIEHEKVLAMANQRKDQLRTFVSKMMIGIDQRSIIKTLTVNQSG